MWRSVAFRVAGAGAKPPPTRRFLPGQQPIAAALLANHRWRPARQTARRRDIAHRHLPEKSLELTLLPSLILFHSLISAAGTQITDRSLAFNHEMP